MDSIYELIEEIGDMKTQMMKRQAALHQEVRKILADDQRIFFDMGPQHPDVHPNKRK